MMDKATRSAFIVYFSYYTTLKLEKEKKYFRLTRKKDIFVCIQKLWAGFQRGKATSNNTHIKIHIL